MIIFLFFLPSRPGAPQLICYSDGGTEVKKPNPLAAEN
jgi:hypothetical protein